MKEAKMKWNIKKIGIFLLSVCVLFSTLPATEVEASEASAVGRAKVEKSEYFLDENITVELTVTGKAGVGSTVPSDVVLILDRSGSMSGKIDSLKVAAKQFVDAISVSYHRLGLVTFASDTTVVDFTTDKSEITTVISEMVASGGTETAMAIDEAVAMLKRDKREDAKPAIVILTDGQFDTVSAAASAKVAIDNDFTFYTIALLDNVDNANVAGTSEYTINQQLKSMATSAKYHYSVGLDTLTDAYNDIAGAVGQENPYNLVVTQTISDAFELVPGSTDDHIPVPTISGQTITWEMKELAGDEKFVYQIRPKTGTIAGKYNNVVTGNVYYETYKGSTRNSSISAIEVVLLDTVLNINSYTPDNGIVGEATSVMVRGSNFHYKDDFRVTVGGKEVALTNVTESTFKFKVPTTLAIGTYDILAYNSATPQKIGTFTYTEAPKVETVLDITSYTPDNGKEGVATTIWVYGNDMKYETDFSVTIGGVEVKTSNKTNAKFKMISPTTLPLGIYDIIVYNGKDATGQKIGTYEVTGELPEVTELDVTSYTPDNGEEGVATTIWVYGNDMKYETDFKVTIGGVEAKASNKTTSKFKIISPTTLVQGTYDILVYNGKDATGQKIGTYEVTEAPLEITELDVTSYTPDNGEEGVATTIWVYGNDMEYETSFKVTIGGVEAKASNKTTSKFKIVSPTTLVQGIYDILVFNGKDSTGQKIGTYEVTEGAPEMTELDVTKYTPDNGEEGVATTIWVYGSAMEYETDFSVTIGGVEAKASNKATSKFKIIAPDTLAKGAHDILVFNGKDSTGQKIGTYTVKEPAPEATELDITRYTPNSGAKGTTTYIWVYGNDMEYEDTFKVTVGGVEVKASNKTATKFKVKVSTALTAGTYDITVYNGKDSTGQIIGTFTVK